MALPCSWNNSKSSKFWRVGCEKECWDKTAVISPDHLQDYSVSMSFGSSGCGAFPGLQQQKMTDSNVKLPVQEEPAPVHLINARLITLLLFLYFVATTLWRDYWYCKISCRRNQDYSERCAMISLPANVAPSVSPIVEQGQKVPYQYGVLSISRLAYSNTKTSQLEDPQGNNQARTLSHLSRFTVCWLFFLVNNFCCIFIFI